MPKSSMLPLESISQKYSKYWRSILFFGLPFVVLYRGIDYMIFWLTTGKSGLVYPWRLVTIMDIPLMFLVSAIWWAIMRQLAAWKRKYQMDNPNASDSHSHNQN